MNRLPARGEPAARLRRILPLLLVGAICAMRIGAAGSSHLHAAGATRLQIDAPSNSTAGSSFAVTVTAQDDNGATVTGYTGAVRFSSSDSNANVQSAYIFTAADHGVKRFTSAVNFRTAGSQTLTVTDGAGVSGMATVAVKPGPAARLGFLTPPPAAAPDTPVTVTLAAQDQFSNVATVYRGTVHFSSSDSAATLPANYAYTGADNGQHSFSVTMHSEGHASLTAADTGPGGPASAAASVNVGAGGGASSGSPARAATATPTATPGATPTPRPAARGAATVGANVAPAAAMPGAIAQFLVTTDVGGNPTAGAAVTVAPLPPRTATGPR